MSILKRNSEISNILFKKKTIKNVVKDIFFFLRKGYAKIGASICTNLVKS